jgi:hypothetical protein
MTHNQIGPVKNVREFLEAVWNRPSPADGAKRLYRGQADNWPLLPKLFRLERGQSGFTGLQFMIMDMFYERSLYLLPSSPIGQYDSLSLAQHHGLPTRLLDWSSNPLMALFFSVDSSHRPRPVVWIFDGTQKQLDDGKQWNLHNTGFDPSPVVIINPTPHSRRVVAQAGWHTVHALVLNRREVGKPQPMTETEDTAHLVGVLIEPTKAQEIKKELREMGIHAATVYGDLTSVCREIQDDLEIPPAMRCGAPKAMEIG